MSFLTKARRVISAIPVFAGLAIFLCNRLDARHRKLLASATHPGAVVLRRVLERLPKATASHDRAVMDRVEMYRTQFLHDHALLSGDLEASGPHDLNVTIATACRHSKRPYQCRFLYHMARETGARNIIELGTNLGISTAYMALGLKAAGGNGRVTTFDASADRLAIARKFHQDIGLDNIDYVQGYFQERLPQFLADSPPVDFVFIDGHHLYASTLAYVSIIEQCAAPDVTFIIDDIRWSGDMFKAWKQLTRDKNMSFSADLYSLGVLARVQDGAAARVNIPVLRPFWHQ